MFCVRQSLRIGVIIPDTANFDLTLRMFSPAHREKLLSDVRRLCRGIAAAHGLEVDIVQSPDYPVTVNASEEYSYVKTVIKRAFGHEAFQQMTNPMAGSEGFAHVLGEVPGALIMLGASVAADGIPTPMNHSPRAQFDDNVLPKAAACLAEFAFSRAAYDQKDNASRLG